MMDILFRVIELMPLFFMFGYVIAALRAKDDIKEIKYLLWACSFLLAGIADAII